MNDTASPLMQQYFSIKSIYKEELIFFQVGDFYELFFEDAKIAASLLSITLTKRGTFQGESIPLCGIPVHMLEQYYPKLIKKGHVVVICDQVEIAKAGKLVQRAVVDIITPSTIFIDSIHENIYSLFITIENNTITLFWFEFSKQEIIYASYALDQEGIIVFKSSFEKHKPKEIITNKISIDTLYQLMPYKKSIKTIDECSNNNIVMIQDFMTNYNLTHQFRTISMLFLYYLDRYFKSILQAKSLLFKEDISSQYLFLDNATIKYLECTTNLHSGEKENTIYDLLDKTKTKMGSRLLKKWILYPLAEKDKIITRQNHISMLIQNINLRKILQDYLATFGDVEKLFQRLRLSKWRDKDFFSLLQFHNNYILFKTYMMSINYQNIFQYIQLTIINEILDLIKTTINIDANYTLNDEMIIINPLCNELLQKKYFLIHHQEEIITHFCESEKQRTGIVELTIKKTPLYHYVFELSKIKEKKYTLPDDYIRVQTLSQKERYTSLALQKLSQEIINAQEDYKEEEKKIKEYIITTLNQHIQSFYMFIESISLLDVYASLAECAIEYNWKKPGIANKGDTLNIILGKHPLISRHSFLYVANSLFLDNEKKTYMITGPNMGGKSTFMKQNALLILLAHIGSYIPAEANSNIPIMEKILTRVGADDSLIEGKSTFFTELEEIKTILFTANEYSFVIIDEIGRGTSTYDGIAIAASVINHLIIKKPYLLCSTHYHELSSLLLQNELSWYNMKAMIQNNSITFLYTMTPGQADNSMGIALAKKIGLPEDVIKQSENYFTYLTKKSVSLLTKTDYILTNKYHQEINSNNNLTKDPLIINFFKKKTIDDISPKEAYLLLEELYYQYKAK